MKTLPILAVLAAIAATTSIIRTQPFRQKTEPPSPPPQASYEAKVAAVGVLEASSENVSIGTHLPGVVEKVFVSVGQSVRTGEPLFRLDARAYEAQMLVRRAALQTAEAQLGTAQAELADGRDQLVRAETLRQQRVISDDELSRRRFAVQTAESRVATAKAAIVTAQAQIRETEIDLERCSVVSPLDGQVLQVKIRAGEFAPAGQTSAPLLMLGALQPLHLRVDVDEHEGWRVRPGARARATVRGNAALATDLQFVRFEPMVVPKRSLTGDSTERVDTRVLQVVYEVLRPEVTLFVGQQMDVFIETPELLPTTASR